MTWVFFSRAAWPEMVAGSDEIRKGGRVPAPVWGSCCSCRPPRRPRTPLWWFRASRGGAAAARGPRRARALASCVPATPSRRRQHEAWRYGHQAAAREAFVSTGLTVISTRQFLSDPRSHWMMAGPLINKPRLVSSDLDWALGTANDAAQRVVSRCHHAKPEAPRQGRP